MANASPIAGFFNVLDEQKPRVIKITFPALPAGEGRAAALRNNGMKSNFNYLRRWTTNRIIDFFLASLIDSLPSQKFTVLLTTTPSSQKFEHVEEELPSYQMDTTMSPLVHMDLKRDADIHARSTNGTIKLVDGPLFERFQFFTPGKYSLTVFAG